MITLTDVVTYFIHAPAKQAETALATVKLILQDRASQPSTRRRTTSAAQPAAAQPSADPTTTVPRRRRRRSRRVQDEEPQPLPTPETYGEAADEVDTGQRVGRLAGGA